jgi:transcription-repair coupling factor (superfamily II helicase)
MARQLLRIRARLTPINPAATFANVPFRGRRVPENWFDAVGKSPAVQSLLQRVEKGGVLAAGGVCAPAQPFLAGLLHHHFPRRSVVVVTSTLKVQETSQQDLETWLRPNRDPAEQAGQAIAPRPPSAPAATEGHGSNSQAPPAGPPLSLPLLFFPAWDILPHEEKLPHVDIISERLETLVALNESGRPGGARPVVNTSVAALLQRTFSPDGLSQRTRRLTRGDRLDPLDLIEWLEVQGYEPEVKVNKKGELSLRGGIVDVFPLTSPWPVRLEFVGDELESLRYFDPVSQLSRQEIPATVLPPAGELGLLKEPAQRSGAPGGEALCSFLSFLPPNTIFLLCEPSLLEAQADDYAAQIPGADPFFVSWAALRNQMMERGLTTLEVTESLEPAIGHCTGPPLFTSLDAFRPVVERAPDPQVAEAQRREFFAQLHRWLRQDYAVHVFCNNEGERQRFGEIWEEYGLGPVPQASWPSPPTPQAKAARRASSSPPPEEDGGETDATSATGARQDDSPAGGDSQEACPALVLGTLSRGFLAEHARLVVVTDAEIFGRYRIQRPRRLKGPHAAALRSALDIDFTELEAGDYVVHLQHGIGRYHGLQAMPGRGDTAGAPREECLVIEYAPREPDQPPPKLYVPVTEAHLVSKYVGAGKARPPLNTLGGTRWAKTKAQAEQAVRDLAGELLSIQAARATQLGHAFAADSSWQREFESAFVFEETPDQLRAILETKADMEKPKPMDRLICGDVGFGKTEVAIRAAFKAVLDGRQVAVLVPTTVLAQQHFNTFRERMADYPVRIELLSRFRTRRAQQQVLTDLATGAVDIVIGTHRLVQQDVGFKELGLVVIDEEQRFGVLHKERFKQLRRLVDVLTLSATPIPRTLYLALTGARDMSTIQTPPHDRLPVETIVTVYDERVLRDAIRRELGRGGQVFFLHNRVLTIQAVADKLRTLLPDARIVVGHGQMHSDELEEVMTRFINGEADVLLSTSIIESGLDIPNANTIIIDRADRFGLSDLYQLRGRVGRYKHQAYAYLIIPRHARLLTDARKRISALRQYSTLGSGFKIAMRDLEIRGAGNLLGPEQSGHIAAVGFDLYCQLLKTSIARAKGEPIRLPLQVHLRLDFLSLNAAPAPEAKRPRTGEEGQEPKENGHTEQEINVPREIWTCEEQNTPTEPGGDSGHPAVKSEPVVACLPGTYIRDPIQRIEFYRRLAQVMAKAELTTMQAELLDRFGPLPTAVELLFLATEIRLLASQRGVSEIATQGDKLMLTRNNDYLTLRGKFPRLTKTASKARLREIRARLMALT